MRPRLSGGHPWDRGVSPWGRGHRCGAGGRTGHGFLRDGVTRETDYQGGGDRLLIIGIVPLKRRLSQRLSERRMNRRTPAPLSRWSNHVQCRGTPKKAPRPEERQRGAEARLFEIWRAPSHHTRPPPGGSPKNKTAAESPRRPVCGVGLPASEDHPMAVHPVSHALGERRMAFVGLRPIGASGECLPPHWAA